MIDKHFFEQTFCKVEPESFLYEFLNSGDPLYTERSSRFTDFERGYNIFNFSMNYWLHIKGVWIVKW